MNKISILTIGALSLASAPISAQQGRLEVCLDNHRNPVGDRAGQGTYSATVTWNPPPGRSGHLVVGAFDTSHVAWVQRTFGVIHGTGPNDSVDFVVSDESAYPLRFAIYRLNDEAYADYTRACQTGDCYFSPSQPGVEILTNDPERPRPSSDSHRDC